MYTFECVINVIHIISHDLDSPTLIHRSPDGMFLFGRESNFFLLCFVLILKKKKVIILQPYRRITTTTFSSNVYRGMYVSFLRSLRNFDSLPLFAITSPFFMIYKYVFFFSWGGGSGSVGRVR